MELTTNGEAMYNFLAEVKARSINVRMEKRCGKGKSVFQCEKFGTFRSGMLGITARVNGYPNTFVAKRQTSRRFNAKMLNTELIQPLDGYEKFADNRHIWTL